MTMKPRTKKILLWVAAILAMLFLIMAIVFFIFRDQILDKTISKVADKMKIEYQSDFAIKEANFDGFSGISMKGISLVPQNGDTLVRIDNLDSKINFWRLFTGELQLGTLFIKDGFVHAIENEKGKNYAAFIKAKKVKSPTNSDKPNIARRAYRLLNTLSNLVPTDMQVENVTLLIENNGKKTTLDLQKLTLIDEELLSSMAIKTGEFAQNWLITGFADPRNKQTDLRFFNKDGGQIKVPYLDEKYNLKSSFDSIRLNISDIQMNGGELHIDGFTSIRNLTVNHKRIASKDVLIDNAQFDFKVRIGPNSLAIDKASKAKLNRIEFHPYLSYNVEKDTVYQLKLEIPKIKAQDFIESLPNGLFTNFEGMEAQGDFDFKLDFEYNKQHPNDLVFETKVNKENFKILKYGEANLTKINGPFTYRAIEDGKAQRAILVAPENGNYTPLNQISPYLRNAVLTSEDPSFFSHKGFINNAFKQSIIKNIKAKKFARGASTISMQLVKNVFLTREKTLSRKLEEILLVYILEDNRIVSKDRMFEVYLNVIEWGPNVFGIGEASNFYFQKHPSQLNLNESVFLAGIVPRPKAFAWQFANDQALKPHVIQKSRFISNLMMRRGLIPASDTTAQHQPVILYGRASAFVANAPEPTAQDSLEIDIFDEFDF